LTVCLRKPANVMLMQPGTQVCLANWALAYAGYLSRVTTRMGKAVSVDANAEGRPGTAANKDGLVPHGSARVDHGGWLFFPRSVMPQN
jgi:hypothetical protein